MLDGAAMMVFRSVDSFTVRDGRPELRRRIFSAASSLASAVPCFVLRLSLTGRFWEKIERVLDMKQGDSPFFRCETREQKTV